MIQIIRYEGQKVNTLLARPEEDGRNVDAAVRGILDDVRARGDAALYDLTEKFDHVRLSSLKVSREEIDEAMSGLAPELLKTLTLSAENIKTYHKRQIRQGYIDASNKGVVLGQRVIPLRRVGLYVPGGTASLSSSVLMNAIPASLAGVKEMVMATPPGRDGKIAPTVLAAARIAGVDTIYKMGGAQAVAALAYGTESVPRVDKIVGPGNIFVATAKRMVYGKVDIDMIAGPSEILVLADGKSDPRFVAADLLSQAEHDRIASAWLVTDSMLLAEAVAAQVEEQLPLLPRYDIARASIDTQGRVIVVPEISIGVDVANLIAPEHLVLSVDDPFSLLPSIENAGSVFLGRYTPESLGDYMAGPNHTLPTGGTARFASPLSVDDFVKKSSFLYYDQAALRGIAPDVERFAQSEGLHAHARAATLRADALDRSASEALAVGNGLDRSAPEALTVGNGLDRSASEAMK